jgi:hypothetical protein
MIPVTVRRGRCTPLGPPSSLEQPQSSQALLRILLHRAQSGPSSLEWRVLVPSEYRCVLPCRPSPTDSAGLYRGWGSAVVV